MKTTVTVIILAVAMLIWTYTAWANDDDDDYEPPITQEIRVTPGESTEVRTIINTGGKTFIIIRKRD